MYGYLDPREFSVKRHRDRFGRFYRAHGRDHVTDTLDRPYVTSPHLCTWCMRCGQKAQWVTSCSEWTIQPSTHTQLTSRSISNTTREIIVTGMTERRAGGLASLMAFRFAHHMRRAWPAVHGGRPGRGASLLVRNCWTDALLADDIDKCQFSFVDLSLTNRRIRHHWTNAQLPVICLRFLLRQTDLSRQPLCRFFTTSERSTLWSLIPDETTRTARIFVGGYSWIAWELLCWCCVLLNFWRQNDRRIFLIFAVYFVRLTDAFIELFWIIIFHIYLKVDDCSKAAF